MKDRRDSKHEFVKNQKWMSQKPKSHVNSDAVCDCGRRISIKEAERNDGLCNDCWRNIGVV